MKHWLAVLLIAATTPALAEQAYSPQSQAINIGHAHTIDSVAMEEARVVNVVLPIQYEREPHKRYPVLYLIDGGVQQDLMHVAGVLQLGTVWGRSADAIVVGIETRDRRKELTGRTGDPELLKRYPTAGSSAAFRAFIRDEIQPLIRSKYRTNGYDAVLGESLAGLFIVETYLLSPSMFDAYAAVDPSLWWDQEALSRVAVTGLHAFTENRPIYLAMAKEQAEVPKAMRRIIGMLRSNGPRWCLAVREDLLHSMIYQQLMPQALQFLLPPRSPPPTEFGFDVQCTEGGQ